MCGIFGIARFKHCKVKPAIIRMILRNLAVASKIRGKDATGYAFTGNKNITIFKHNVFADAFVELPNYKEVVRNNISSSDIFGTPYSVIGHTRMQTQGHNSNPFNNHPIKTGSIVGVHNGQISNDRSIFEDLRKNDITRIAEVDSEAIFSLVDYHSKIFKTTTTHKQVSVLVPIKDPTTKAIIQASKKLRGSYACALVDADNPKSLWLFKNNGSLTVHYYEEEGLLIFASAESFIEKAITLYNFNSCNSIAVEADSGICVNIETGIYNAFKLESFTISNSRYMCY